LYTTYAKWEWQELLPKVMSCKGHINYMQHLVNLNESDRIATKSNVFKGTITCMQLLQNGSDWIATKGNVLKGN